MFTKSVAQVQHRYVLEAEATPLNGHILDEAHCHACLYLLADLAVSEPHEIYHTTLGSEDTFSDAELPKASCIL